jgi:hypothetical protein
VSRANTARDGRGWPAVAPASWSWEQEQLARRVHGDVRQACKRDNDERVWPEFESPPEDGYRRGCSKLLHG